MSASLPTLEEATGARAGEIDLEYNPMDTLEQSADTWEAAYTMYELVGRHDSQQEVNWRQDGNPSLIGRDTMLQMRSNGSRAQAETSRMHNYHNLPDAEHDGVLLGGCDRVQSFGWQELSSGISKNTVPTQEYQHNAGISPLGNNQERVMLTFPEGEDDAVLITQGDMECRNVERSRLTKTPNGQSRSKKWSAEETSVLVNRMVAGGRQRKGSGGGTHWSVISEELKSVRSEEECRRRFDTLLKAYKTMKEYMEKSGKAFCDIQGEELKKLKLATPLSEGWYKDLETIWLHRKGGNGKSGKRAKLSSNDSDAKLDSVSRGAGATGPSGSCERDRLSWRQVAIPGFSTLDEDLRCTLLNLVQSSYQRYRAGVLTDPIYPELEEICCWLTTVQDRKPSEIRRYVLQLWKLKFVKFAGGDSFDDRPVLNLVGLRVYRKFVEKVLCKIPALITFMQIYENKRAVSFPEAPILSTLQRIRVLGLYCCWELKEVDLRNFPELRSLTIVSCEKLKAIRGWEVVKKLGWLEVRDCSFDLDSCCVERLPSLRVFHFSNGDKEPQVLSVVDFSPCVRLRRLEIWGGESWGLQSMDVSRLSVLEVLVLSRIVGLSTVEGLGGLHCLTKLVLSGCEALRRVPELGCLKALTKLVVDDTAVEEIPGVEELHLLTVLRLGGCKSLKWLPSLGNLKALGYLDIDDTGVEEIPGVEDLVSLKEISCSGSGLTRITSLD